MKKVETRALLFLASLMMAFSLGTLFTGNEIAEAQGKKEQQQETTVQPPKKIKMGDPLPANLFVELAKSVNPAIVNISTSSMPKQRRGRLHNDPMFDMLERFWGPGFMPPGQPQPRPAQALGSGFVIREDGLIITNNHVIEAADVINVQIGEDDTTYEASVIGRDAMTDIALIKVDVDKKLPKLKLGNSSALEVGEWVAAFGNPFGHAHSMTKGIISAKGREIGELNQFPFLQTDASINPGNSGGPLVNTRGEVIGVNTAIDARAQGIGFAIPIDSVKSILEQLESNGRIRRGFLGVVGVALNQIAKEARSTIDVKAEQGVLVTEVVPGSAAEKAGIKVYDVITEFNGEKIRNMQDLVRSVGLVSPGKKSEIKVDRAGKIQSFSAQVGERTEDPQQLTGSPQGFKGQDAPHDIGFQVAQISDEMRSSWGLNPRFANRPVVVGVVPGSPASQAGLREGDIILDVNRRGVSNPKDVQKALRKGTNSLRIVRGNQPPALILIQAP